ncbi:MAG: NADH-quinone oxidoreductase subunit C [Elusimicrobiota bacterium]|nr:NADH-quinone oxidoreductase subunit C [Endomicrobiia bacterium]MCX7910803.1 NADH-quinone oxidoreductase subunit C [Endomicrobiia bacterium]MDW8164922.1 NADH-quinone oxidoreductase subunit C [Elusimicrobiota bacterium]
MSEIINKITQRISEDTIELFKKNDRRYYIEIKPESIKKVASLLFNELGFRFITATGMDCEKYFEIIYHFSYDKTGEIVSLRVKLSKEKPEIYSLSSIFSAAEWIEREIWEMIGINFIGHPNLKHLLLSDDWPDNSYPLREK